MKHCENCSGTGKYRGEPCKHCGGTGKVKAEEAKEKTSKKKETRYDSTKI